MNVHIKAMLISSTRSDGVYHLWLIYGAADVVLDGATNVIALDGARNVIVLDGAANVVFDGIADLVVDGTTNVALFTAQ